MSKLSIRSKILTLALAFGPALILGIAAIVPGANYIYSGHGGPAWIFLPFAFPFALFILLVGPFIGPVEERDERKRLAMWSIIAYAPSSLVLAFAGAYSIQATYGLTINPLGLWSMFMSPLWLVFSI